MERLCPPPATNRTGRVSCSLDPFRRHKTVYTSLVSREGIKTKSVGVPVGQVQKYCSSIHVASRIGLRLTSRHGAPLVKGRVLQMLTNNTHPVSPSDGVPAGGHTRDAC